uniref:Uncharacterized protein n=1 Tax=Dulem virus 42 TaxID=3145760 RepID=A0AAU8BAZ3_9CAUD
MKNTFFRFSLFIRIYISIIVKGFFKIFSISRSNVYFLRRN